MTGPSRSSPVIGAQSGTGRNPQGEAGAFVLPLLPSVAPAAFELPRSGAADSHELLSSPCSSSGSWGKIHACRQHSSESGRSFRHQHEDSDTDSEESADDGFDSSFDGSDDDVTSPRSKQSPGGALRSADCGPSEVTPAAATSSVGVTANQPLQPSVWGRSAKASPDIVRIHPSCVAMWCIVDGEGLMGLFPASAQIQWWHNVHRLVDTTVKQADLCQADGGPRGFCIVPGSAGREPSSSIRATIDCALELLTLLKKVQLPSGHPVSVRIGIHLGPAADGLVGAGRTLHYQMAGPTVETANQLALFAPVDALVASGPVVRHLTAGGGSVAASGFVRGRPVPLTYTREIATHTFVGSLPQVSEEAKRLLDSLSLRSSPSPDSPFAAYFEGGRHTLEATSSSGAEPSSSSYSSFPQDVANCNGFQTSSQCKQPVYPNFALAKQCERVSWHERQFQELYKLKVQKACCVANLLLTATMLLGLFSAEPWDSDTAAVQPVLIAAALLLAVLSCFTVVSGQFQSRLSGAARIGRVVLLLTVQHLRLRGQQMSWKERGDNFVAMSIPLVGVSLLEGNLMPARIRADLICVALALAASPLVWLSSGTPAASFLVLQVVLGVALPTAALKGLQVGAQREFSTYASHVLHRHPVEGPQDLLDSAAQKGGMAKRQEGG